MQFDLEYLKKLAKLVKENNLSEITIEEDDACVSIRREAAQIQTTVMPVSSQAVSPKIISVQNTKEKEEKKEQIHKGIAIKSPMVGTFYCSPSPDDAPFVKVGDNISTGQVVCIIEAMKLMNEIEADNSGKVTEICVKNGDSVEFGQVLMYVE